MRGRTRRGPPKILPRRKAPSSTSRNPRCVDHHHPPRPSFLPPLIPSTNSATRRAPHRSSFDSFVGGSLRTSPLKVRAYVCYRKRARSPVEVTRRRARRLRDPISAPFSVSPASSSFYILTNPGQKSPSVVNYLACRWFNSL